MLSIVVGQTTAWIRYRLQNSAAQHGANACGTAGNDQQRWLQEFGQTRAQQRHARSGRQETPVQPDKRNGRM